MRSLSLKYGQKQDEAHNQDTKVNGNDTWLRINGGWFIVGGFFLAVGQRSKHPRPGPSISAPVIRLSSLNTKESGVKYSPADGCLAVILGLMCLFDPSYLPPPPQIQTLTSWPATISVWLRFECRKLQFEESALKFKETF